MKNNQTIKCNVYNCKHCNIDNISCNLKEIKIANCNNKQATMCYNYESKKD